MRASWLTELLSDQQQNETRNQYDAASNMREITIRRTTLFQRICSTENFFSLSLCTGDEFTENGNPGLVVINYLQPNVAGKVRPSNEKSLSHKLPVSRKQLLKFLIRI